MEYIEQISKQTESSTDRFARELFDCFPQDGPIVALIDGDGSCQASDSETFIKVFPTSQQLNQLCSRIQDGNEPLVTQIDSYGVIAGAIKAAGTDIFGYLIVILPDSSPEMTLASIELVETILNQACLLAQYTFQTAAGDESMAEDFAISVA